MSDQDRVEKPALGIMERGYRGAVEKQFFDAFYLAAELHRHPGGLDLLLRGQAATHAVRARPTPSLRLGDTELDTVTDSRVNLRNLIEAGVRVWVEESALAAFGFAAPLDDVLMDGIRVAADGELALRWPEYRAVYFL
ncbi:hypothetical protein [Streptomyces rubellomurinus]|uniref:Uncharacterized protein n=2 Tax=Streptomyces TaxID=1883 RepID=A0A0F2T7D4_STRR3|nr:hypothetical protein [Streptomyces rubellomurinus]KJS54223.1 hypothetical protein VM98_20480 [Streptomyces rubellomurinus subsp. indigoferus]KJS59129.1 hypothetical protein VM95_28985 [Streptomyces rubellomurinus]